MVIHPFKSWAVTEPIHGDASARRYYRVEKSGKIAVLMDCSVQNPQDKKIKEFVSISHWLNQIGLRAPAIYEQDENDNFLLIENFGNTSFKAAMKQGGDITALYYLASNAQKKFFGNECPLKLPDYYQSRVHKGRRRIIDWYAPTVHQKKNPDGWLEEYLKTWDQVEKFLPPCPQGFVHGDYHPENLMWLSSEQGLKRCGIIDFQDAMIGPAPYDLANLLEDARTDVQVDIQNALLQPYDDTFRAWYRVLATQFHCRIAGWCIVKALVDNKPQYMAFLPRIENYLQRALKDPLLKPLKLFFSEIGLDFQNTKDLNAALSKAYIREDAF